MPLQSVAVSPAPAPAAAPRASPPHPADGAGAGEPPSPPADGAGAEEPPAPASSWRGLHRLVWLSRCLGFAPYQQFRGQSGAPQYRMSWAWRAYSILLFLSTGAFTLSLVLTTDYGMTGVARVAFAILKALVLVITPMMAWLQWFRSYPRLLGVLNNLEATAVSRLSIVPSALSVLLSVSVSYAPQLNFFFKAVSVPVMKAFQEAVLFVGYVQVAVYFTLVAGLVHCIYCRIDEVNRALLAFKAASKQRKKCDPEPSLSDAFRSVRQKYLGVLETLSETNECFGPFLLLYGLVDFWSIVLGLFIHFGQTSDFFVICLPFSVCLRWLYMIIISAAVAYKLQMFAQLLREYPVRVTLLGDIDLNVSLLFQVWTSIITFLVILLQFENDSSDEKP